MKPAIFCFSLELISPSAADTRAQPETTASMNSRFLNFETSEASLSRAAVAFVFNQSSMSISHEAAQPAQKYHGIVYLEPAAQRIPQP